MRAFKIMMILCFYIFTGCSVNILSEFGDKTTDEALLFDAKMKIDEGDWTSAIEKFAEMSDDFRDERDVRALEASAYAGRCGLRFLDLIDIFTNIGSTLLFRELMESFPGATAAQATDCAQAETLIKQIDATATNRTVDENLLMAFLSFVKIGVILSANADANGDGVPNWASGDACSAVNITDANVNQIGTAIANANASLSAVGSASNIGGGQLDSLEQFCAVLDDAPLDATYDFCSALNTTDMTANMRRALRSIIQENQYVGIGSCNNTFVNCICP